MIVDISWLVRSLKNTSIRVLEDKCLPMPEDYMTRKKVQRVALQRCLDYRASFVANVFTFSKEMFVWIDETGSDMKDMLRRYGYALSELYVVHY